MESLAAQCHNNGHMSHIAATTNLKAMITPEMFIIPTMYM